MVLTDEQKIQICDYYINNQDKLGTTEIEGYDSQDIANLLVSITGGGGLTIGKVEDYKRKIESHLLNKKSNVIQEKGLSYKRAIIIIILTAIITNLDRIIKFVISLFNQL
ncbi:MAG: hypothetical protein ABIH59_00885 [archaeon]